MREHAIINTLECSDVDAYSDLFDDWTHRTIQTDTGRFGYTGHSIELPGLKIFLDNHGRSIRWCEYPHVPVTAIFVPLACAGEIRWRGLELTRNSAVLQASGNEQHFVAGPNMQALFVDISQELVEDLGWQGLQNGHMTMASRPRRNFVNYCLELIKAPGKRYNANQQVFIRNRVLYLLREMLVRQIHNARKSGPAPPVTVTDFEVLIAFEEALLSTGYDRPVCNAGLARQIGISERRLYRVFEDQLGLSPSRYIELLRLHALRARLLSADRAGAKIADTMAEFGFTNAGRTARRYSELFREYPKQTSSRAQKSIWRAA